MKNSINKLVYEPLLHFLFLGVLLYIYFDLFSVTMGDDKKIISVSQTAFENRNNYQEGFPNTLLVKKEYQDKILLHEAYLQGLHEEDTQIRKKLISKMQFIIENSISVKEPTEEELYEYYEKNKDNYSVKKTLSFYNVFFQNLEKQNQKNMYSLLRDEDGKIIYDFSIKYPNNMKKQYEKISIEELESMFGKYFTIKILGEKKDTFSQAIPSKDGIHFIYIYEYTIGEKYPFDEVIYRVYRDYKSEILQNKRKDFFIKLENTYSLEVSND